MKFKDFNTNENFKILETKYTSKLENKILETLRLPKNLTPSKAAEFFNTDFEIPNKKLQKEIAELANEGEKENLIKLLKKNKLNDYLEIANSL